MDTVKNAAEGVKTHGSSVAIWVKNSVRPNPRNMLPASPGPPQTGIPSEPAANSAASASLWVENKVLICSRSVLFAFAISLRTGVTEEQQWLCCLMHFIYTIYFNVFISVFP